MFELFMDLDKNNDNFVDRKDLIKYYGMLQRIKGASVETQYKCKNGPGHRMIKIVHDQNCAIKEKVRLGFTKEDMKAYGYKKYNGTIAEVRSDYNSQYKEQFIKCHDNSEQYFKPWHYVKVDSPIHPGKEVFCCADKGCVDKPVDRK